MKILFLGLVTALIASGEAVASEPAIVKYKNRATAIAFHPEGLLAIAQEGGCVRLLRENGTGAGEIETGQSFIETVTFSSNGRFMATGSYLQGDIDNPRQPGHVKIWKVLTEKGKLKEAELIETHGPTSGQVVFSPDSRILAAAIGQLDGDQKVELFDLESKQWQPALAPNGPVGIEGCIDALACSPDGKTLGVSTSTSRKIYAIKVREGEAKLLSLHGPGHGGLTFTGDGEKLLFPQAEVATVGDSRIVNKRWISVWSIKEDKEVSSLSGAWAFPVCSPDGKFIAAGGGEEVQKGQVVRFEGRVSIWSAQGNVKCVLKVKSGPVGTICFSPDGQGLAAVAGTGNDWHVVWWKRWSR